MLVCVPDKSEVPARNRTWPLMCSPWSLAKIVFVRVLHCVSHCEDLPVLCSWDVFFILWIVNQCCVTHFFAQLVRPLDLGSPSRGPWPSDALRLLLRRPSCLAAQDAPDPLLHLCSSQSQLCVRGWLIPSTGTLFKNVFLSLLRFPIR